MTHKTPLTPSKPSTPRSPRSPKAPKASMVTSPGGGDVDDKGYQIPGLRLGVRDAKANLSWALREVKQGREIVITEYGKPLARLVPARALSLEERLAEMERRGEIEPVGKPRSKPLPLFDVPEGLVERLLEEGREWPRR